MKIDYCLMGSTENPYYLDFWPVVSKVWKTKFNITPVLGLICNEDSDLIEGDYGIIKKIKKSPFSNPETQSQIIRLYLSKFLNGNCVISDIDMAPLSKKYFIDDISKFSDNDILIMSSHHSQTINTNQYPMCYVIGHTDIFNKIFKTNLCWDDFVKESATHGWYSDQLFLYKSIQSYGVDNVKFPYRSFNNDRVDRSSWHYDENMVKNGEYVDSHLLRPYGMYSNEITKLIDLIP